MNANSPIFDGESQTAARYLGAVRHHWLRVLAVVFVTVLVAVVYSVTATKRYEAEADVLVAPLDDSENTFVGIDVLRDQDKSVLIAARMVKTLPLADAVKRRLGLTDSARTVLEAIKVKPVPQSNVVAIIAKAESPSRAAEIASGFADALLAQRKAVFQRELRVAVTRLRQNIQRGSPGSRDALENRLATLEGQLGANDPTLSILARATPPPAAEWPRPFLSIAVALFVGLVFGIGAALVFEFFEPRIVAENELERLPVLAWVPRAPRAVVRRYLRGDEALPGDLWEAYRTLRASLGARGLREGSPHSILVTSAITGEGKTMTSVNLAITLAAAGFRVILVDGDFRRAGVGTAFGIPASGNAFAELLSGERDPDELLVPAPRFGARLRLLLAGDERPVDLLERRRIEGVLSVLKQQADVIIIDSPPLTQFADAVALADASDVVLLAVRLGYSRRDKFTELLRFLDHHGVQPAGFVVTTRRHSRGAGYPPGYEQVEPPELTAVGARR